MPLQLYNEVVSLLKLGSSIGGAVGGALVFSAKYRHTHVAFGVLPKVGHQFIDAHNGSVDILVKGFIFEQFARRSFAFFEFGQCLLEARYRPIGLVEGLAEAQGFERVGGGLEVAHGSLHAAHEGFEALFGFDE